MSTHRTRAPRGLAEHDLRAASTATTTQRSPNDANVVLVLDERRDEHTSSQRDGRLLERGPSEQLAALRLVAERRGASVRERHRHAATNVARNYYDGGRDFAVEHTLELRFASVDAAVALLTSAKPALVVWLASRGMHGATLSVGAAELVLGGNDDVDRALALLVRIADGPDATR